MCDETVRAGNGENSPERSTPNANADLDGPESTTAEAISPQPALGVPKRVSQKPANSVKTRCRNLLKLWEEFSRPWNLLIGFASIVCSLSQFFVGFGNLSYPMLGFAAISLFALLVPKGAPRLFAMRTFAFAIDILLLAFLTIVALTFYPEVQGRPSEFVIRCVVWLWFIYFLFFDWRFKGTPGKRMLGLRLVSQKSKNDFVEVLLRTVLTLLVPLIGGIWIGSLFTHSISRIGFAAWVLVQTSFLLAIPYSVLVLGGNRGFADRATDTEVRFWPRRGRSIDCDVTLRSWVLAATLPIAGGLAIATCGFILEGIVFPLNPSIHIPLKPTGTELNSRLFWNDPKGIFKAHCLTPGFRDPSKDVFSVEIETLSNNPFTTKNTDFPVNPIDAANLQKAGGLALMRITTSSLVSPADYTLMLVNLSKCSGAALSDGEHVTRVIQFRQVNDYGFFATERLQNTVLGMDRKSSSADWTLSDLRPKSFYVVSINLELGAYALLGEGSIRERALYGN